MKKTKISLESLNLNTSKIKKLSTSHLQGINGGLIATPVSKPIKGQYIVVFKD